MRTTSAALVLLALLAAVSAQQVITDFSEFQRKKAEYDAQKAKYDEFQALKNVPLLASYDLIPKVKEHEAPAGNAEQLLPTYTGIPVNFNEAAAGRALVEPGNTAQNYFHQGPIPAKKSSSPSAPVVIPTGPGQDFIVPQDDGSAAPAVTAPADTPVAASRIEPHL
ncbi:uncharacterized protein LOC117654414 [Thrips palmi]|uniref:Uncharacterized protein LOC117654414 n=1 Tax=Thrips palmi TaxID=161013 RepID=A0A6P9AHK9_THRPL|nr:uncharacterized protein LOC117654414 [Thrips palmi]